MAFTPEDGTGVAGANSYRSVAEFKAYHDDRGFDYSSFSNTQIEQALVRASEYVDKRFGPLFRGFRRSKGQGLEWPRLDAIDNDGFLLDGVPLNLGKAINEYAARALRLNPLAPDPQVPYVDRTTLGQTAGQNTKGEGIGPISLQRKKIGPLEKTFQWRTREISLEGSLPKFPEADLLLRELLISRTSRELGRA